MAVDVQDLVRYLDNYLQVTEVPDSANALNGLQLEGPGPVRRLAVAVDASEDSVRAAIEAEADLLLVHHGLFWDGNVPLTGRRYRRVAPLIRAGVALYSAHIPLDAHEAVGNNIVLARELGLDIGGRFAEYKGLELGVWGRVDVDRNEFVVALERVLGRNVQMIPGGGDRLRKVGVLTGGGGSFIEQAVDFGLDALVTGEGSHHTYFDAVENGLTLYYGGHYATETWGVRALAAHLEERFGLEWVFIDQPTGL